MTLMTGDKINIGFGIENPSARGTIVAAQGWIPGRTPTGVDVQLSKVLLKETRASGVMSQGSEIVQRFAQGSLEFNLRSETLGYLLKSLLGSCNSSVVSGSYMKHAFTLQANNPQFPTLSLSLAQAASFQDYAYKNALVKSLEIKTPVDDLVNATAEFLASDEDAVSAHVVDFSDTDYLFRPQNVTIKVAADVSGLAAAVAINAKEFSLTIDNSAIAQQHIGSLTPTDVIAGLLDVGGSLSIDYTGTTYHDLFKAGTYRAIEITLERTDIDLGSGKTPKMVITLPRISIEKLEQTRELEGLVIDNIEFKAHYDADAEYAITADLYNTVVDYEYDSES